MHFIDPNWILGFAMAALAFAGHFRLERSRSEAKADRAKIADLDARIDELETKVVVLETENGGLRKERDGCRERLAEVMEENRKLHTENVSLLKSLSAFGDRISAHS